MEMLTAEECYKRHCERKKVYKSFGYYIDAEMNFILKKAQPIQGGILEIGTGKGYFACILAQKGFVFTTVDTSDDEQAFARQNIKYLGRDDQVVFAVENAESLSFPNDQYSVVFAVNLFHHLASPLRVINEMMRVIKPGGKIVISDFNDEGFSIIERIHISEGRTHERAQQGLSHVREYIETQGMQADQYESACQKLVICHM